MTRNYLSILAETIRTNWHQPALTDFYLTEDDTAQDTSRGNHYTYGEMYAEICRVAELLTSLGLQKGEHIAICGANSAHWVIAYLAIAKMQGVSVTVMHSLQPDEITRLVAFSDAKALFVDEEIWRELLPSFQERDGDRLSSVISLADWSILRGEKNTNYQLQITNGEIGFSPVEPDSLAMICFTSGTSGSAKGVMFSIKGLSMGLNMVCDSYPVSHNHNVLSILPFAHVLAFGGTIATLLQRCHVHILASAITPATFATTILAVRPYIIHIIPQLIPVLLNPQFLSAYYAGTEIDYLVVGGAKCSMDWILAAQEKRLPITIGYGLTEMCVISTSVPSKYIPGTSGQVCEVLSCRVGSNGEILIKGDEMMLGYYKDPEATAAKIDSDGWLHTGDKGHLDEDGYLYVEGRLEQDIIVLPNGENIRPDNIESLINALPEVSESLVLARNGHLVAIVVPSSPLALGEGQGVRLSILRAVNPQLPLFSQLYDIEITDTPLQRTEKQTIKRYLYK